MCYRGKRRSKQRPGKALKAKTEGTKEQSFPAPQAGSSRASSLPNHYLLCSLYSLRILTLCSRLLFSSSHLIHFHLDTIPGSAPLPSASTLCIYYHY